MLYLLTVQHGWGYSQEDMVNEGVWIHWKYATKFYIFAGATHLTKYVVCIWKQTLAEIATNQTVSSGQLWMISVKVAGQHWRIEECNSSLEVGGWWISEQFLDNQTVPAQSYRIRFSASSTPGSWGRHWCSITGPSFSEFVFKVKLHISGILWSYKYRLFIVKIHISRGGLIDVSAKQHHCRACVQCTVWLVNIHTLYRLATLPSDVLCFIWRLHLQHLALAHTVA